MLCQTASLIRKLCAGDSGIEGGNPSLVAVDQNPQTAAMRIHQTPLGHDGERLGGDGSLFVQTSSHHRHLVYDNISSGGECLLELLEMIPLQLLEFTSCGKIKQ